MTMSALLFGLAGCASAPPVPYATAAEKQATVGAYMNCLIPYAKRLDDGRSDANTIALAMRGACPSESAAMLEASTRGENDAVKEGIRRGIGSVQKEIALHVVLEIRRSQSK